MPPAPRRQGCSSTLPAECAVGVPLLRFAAEGVPAMPLLQAMLEEPLALARLQTCDRCGTTERSITDRLLIPSGASVVVALCWQCKLHATTALFPGPASVRPSSGAES
jgi:hypothetical protein